MKTYLQKSIEEIEPGVVFYINAVNLSVSEIEYLKAQIRAGLILPQPANYRMFVDDAFYYRQVATGEILAAQGEYVKPAKPEPERIKWLKPVYYSNGGRDRGYLENAVSGNTWYAWRQVMGNWYLWAGPDRNDVMTAAAMGLVENAEMFSDLMYLETYLSEI